MKNIGIFDFASNSIIIDGKITKGILFNYSYGEYFMFIEQEHNEILTREFESECGGKHCLPVLFDKHGKHLNYFPLRTPKNEKSKNLLLL